MSETLRKQLALVADRLDAMDKYVFAGTVRKAMAENDEAQLKLGVAQTEIEALRGRVAELAKFVGAGDRLCYELESWLATEHDKESQRAINIWKRLRHPEETASKQAEQMENGVAGDE